MIRPAILTFLRKGKMICQKVYPTLIDTWNYVVSRVDNIKGDQDVNAAEGWITVDNTKPTHPVIRFDSSKLQNAISGDVLVDSQVADLQLSSIQYLSSDQGQALDLYDFDKTSPTKSMALSALVDDPQSTDNDWLVVKHNTDNGNVLQYVSLSSLGISADVINEISGDSNQERTSFFSIDTHTDENGHKCHQLYLFDAGCYTHEVSGMTEFQDSAGLDYNTFDPAYEIIWRVQGGYPSESGCVIIDYAHGKLYQRHEHLDGDNVNVPHSLNWKSGSPKEIQLYNFSANTTDNNIKKGTVNYTQNDGLVVRKSQQVEYMSFCNLSTFVPRSIADSQVPNTSNRSLSSEWNSVQEKDVFELYDWKNGGSSSTIDLHMDGETYQWPQDTTSPVGQDYFLIKHVENGQTTLEYKELYINQMSVDMQGIEDIEDWIHNTYHDYGPEITYLSGVIDDLSGHLSANYWETGGDSTTNTCQDAHIDSLTADYINCDGCVDFGSVNCTYGVFAGCYLGAGSYLQIGNTSLYESQLQQLLRLI